MDPERFLVTFVEPVGIYIKKEGVREVALERRATASTIVVQE